MLADDDFVIRGGVMLSEDLERSVARGAELGERGLSIYADPGATAHDVAIRRRLPHRMLRVSTVGRIRAAGYDVVDWRARDGHCTIALPAVATEADWIALRGAFGAPIKNPARTRQ